ncbi:hypothetical protein [Haloplanus salilacus]|uniref:hypothetical protein n=1 Tax=Haloplanus salilacus TaxID=2949994 RepID=UPI0030D48E6A
MDSGYPTRRPTAAIRDEAGGISRAFPPGATDIPWIDIHQHTGTRGWEQHEKMDVSGAHAVVMTAASYFQAPYRPIEADDWRFLRDRSIQRTAEVSRNHFFDVTLAVGLHFGARTEGADELLEETGCYLSFSLVRHGESNTPEDIAGVIDDHGSDRDRLRPPRGTVRRRRGADDAPDDVQPPSPRRRPRGRPERRLLDPETGTRTRSRGRRG